MLNPSSPLFVELTLWTLYILLAAALALTVWSMVRSLAMRRQEKLSAQDRKSGRMAAAIALLVALLLVGTYAMGSTDALTINGRPFTDGFWLRISDMLINTSLILMLLAAIASLVSISGWGRRMK